MMPLNEECVFSARSKTMVMTVEEAQLSLSEVIDKVVLGESVTLMRHNRAVAVLVSPQSSPVVPEFGCCRDMLTMESDDNDHLADFAEYMP